MGITTREVVVRHWGSDDAKNGHIPHRLDEFINELMQARLEIPQEHWAEAFIEVDAECPYDDCYPRFIVAFSRPEKPDETAARKAEEHEHWQEQLQKAQERIAYCEEQLGALS
ncbi:hypothetical protein ACFOLL_12715 [Falsochrobactrum ovis]|uniref:Uncharacterized protein n=1 Tax=Falsochrobactrum ovis TaxID=1293442 RepID=A0A364JST1_9HYPH|nr:hypothetical protein [Falsochrobactrum ovis]RAK26353.1 hypothetical protein C7374_11438 [Falsochrobactrum ovis]